jgi:hypothetical protein
MNFAWRIYRRLAQAFPHEFKLAYGAEVTQLGEDVVEEIAKRQGVAGLIRLIADIAIRVPLEYLSEMRGDMRYGSRALIKSPGFALVGIISMGLAIGLTTNVYSSKWKMLFRDLPAAANAKRLVMVQESTGGDLARVSYYYVEQYREQKSLFVGVAAFQSGVPFNTTFQGDLNAKPERVFGQLVSADYFSVLGVQPQRGRVLSPELDKAGEATAVVISDRFWRNRLNSSPNALGQTLRLNGQLATIVGITPKGFNGALGMNPAELFVPITAPAALAPELANDVLHQHNAKEFLAIMCLAPGVTIESAEAGLDAITRNLDQQDPSSLVRTDKGRRVSLLSAGTNIPMPPEIEAGAGWFFHNADGAGDCACVHESGEHADGARRKSPKRVGDSLGDRSQPFSFDSADDVGRYFAFAAGRRGGICVSVWPLDFELSLHSSDDGAVRIRFQPGLARGSFCVRTGAGVRRRIQSLACSASHESGSDSGAERRFGAAFAGLPPLWPSQPINGGAGCGFAHVAADYRLFGDRHQQDQQRSNHIRSEHDVSFVHRSGARRLRSRKIASPVRETYRTPEGFRPCAQHGIGRG